MNDSGFLIRNMEARRKDTIHFLRSPSRMKMSFKNEEEIKASSEEEKKTREFVTSRPVIKKWLKKIL